LFSQSRFQTWPTISLKGEVIDNLDVKFKYRNKYDHKESSSVTSWFNMGLEYKLNKSSFGIYYRELQRIKSSEKRPFVEFEYEVNNNMKLRLRNALRIKEGDKSFLRYRIRYQYEYDNIKRIKPFVYNEIFISKESLKRNRLGFGSKFKVKKMPFDFRLAYLIEMYRDVENSVVNWSTKNALLVSLDFKI
tara:strand:- start:221 stop:790 length:570 start_codon:yes stop_codon:yes gene_type:complete